MELLQIVSSFTTTSWIFLILIFLISFIKLMNTNKSKPPNLPPGPWKLPIIGSMHHMMEGSLAHHTLTKLAKKYGPIIHLKLGQTLLVVASSAETAKLIMKTHDLSFADRPGSLATDVISFNKSEIAFSPYSDYWRQMKKICVLELLSTKQVKSYYSIREQEVSNLISLIEKSVGTIINLSAQLSSLSSSIICRALFGENLIHGPGALIDLGIVWEAITLMDGFDLTNSFPSLKIIAAFTGMNKRLQNFRTKVDKMLDNVIKKRKEYYAEMKKTGEQQENGYLLDVLLRLQQENEQEFRITDDSVKAVILDMFLAGSESSATVVEWAMSELIKNPRVLEKAQSSVRQSLDEKKNTEESDTHAYINLIIKETLRLHPPGPLLVARECRETCEINGYTIPIKSKVLINAWAIARDPEFWDNAESFIPERFENNMIDYRGTNFEFVPFGAGRRICPGITFGLATIELALTQLLYHFNWKLPNNANSEELDMSETTGIAAKRKNPLLLIASMNRGTLAN